MTDYLRPQTLLGVLRTSFGIYFRHWLIVVGVCGLPTVPLYAVYHFALLEDDQTLAVVALLATYLVQILTISALSVVVADICLGYRPGVKRAYARAFATPGRLLGTYLLTILFVILGLVALVIPGIVLSIWYLFAQPVVVLEARGGMAALRRSKELGKGFYWRNFGVYILMIVVFSVLIGVLSAAITLALIFLQSDLGIEFPTAVAYGQAGGLLVNVALSPLLPICVVLLYYDMRVRKEGYGAAQLTEDLGT